ncbi:hypothetical protein A11Q_897 [Pseudobdellovibrio exovorus JSS]|uniref:PilZ domain-containing protein n=2 Tax=Pseudobdellovibrio exovorus TaxID=453816 RepID=M4V7D3_9BACT|nr:hypothetical protein A11Q_897 [Pseudobdellovibrio exovorus JSS]
MFGGKANMAFGVEIGEGGMSIKTNETLAVDQKLILNFFLSEKDFFSIRATLRNVASLANTTETIYGVSFDDVPIALRRQIRTYVARTI